MIFRETKVWAIKFSLVVAGRETNPMVTFVAAPSLAEAVSLSSSAIAQSILKNTMSEEDPISPGDAILLPEMAGIELAVPFAYIPLTDKQEIQQTERQQAGQEDRECQAALDLALHLNNTLLQAITAYGLEISECNGDIKLQPLEETP